MLAVADQGEVTIQCLMGLRKYGRPPSEEQRDLTGNYFCYLNNVGITGLAQMLEIDASTFDTTNAVNTYTYDYLYKLLKEDKSILHVGPLTEGLAKTEGCIARRAMYLPFEMVV